MNYWLWQIGMMRTATVLWKMVKKHGVTNQFVEVDVEAQ
jgi:hypothetical protein